MQSSIAPGLLLAMPQLVDSNFSRAVVLMIEHDEHGSFGLIVNQPIRHPVEISAGELLDSLDMPWGGRDDTPVWSGGPVQPNTGWILHEPLDHIPVDSDSIGPGGTMLVCPDVALSTSPETLRIIAAEPPSRIRLILGYSGWGAGQLASEMATGSWLHVDATAALVFDTPADEIWEQAIGSLGIDPKTIIQGVGIH